MKKSCKEAKYLNFQNFKTAQNRNKNKTETCFKLRPREETIHVKLRRIIFESRLRFWTKFEYLAKCCFNQDESPLNHFWFFLNHFWLFLDLFETLSNLFESLMNHFESLRIFLNNFWITLESFCYLFESYLNTNNNSFCRTAMLHYSRLKKSGHDHALNTMSIIKPLIIKCQLSKKIYRKQRNAFSWCR